MDDLWRSFFIVLVLLSRKTYCIRNSLNIIKILTFNKMNLDFNIYSNTIYYILT